MKQRVYLALSLVGIAVGLIVPVDPETFNTDGVSAMNALEVETLDLSAYSDAALGQPLNLLFIHHSCGGQLLAEPGPDKGSHCIYESHPNGGGLRSLLQNNGYTVHEASYGSDLGRETDLFDWWPKFRDRMDAVLTCRQQDLPLADGARNQVVLFKSCYPNNAFVSAGTHPGNPAGPQLTVHNAKASYRALLTCFDEYPDVLFVCVTAPPLAPALKPVPLWKALARKMMGKEKNLERQAGWARQFNTWLKAGDGWLESYDKQNVVVWDYYDILTGSGRSNLSRYPTGDGYDSHPSQEGNRRAAAALVPYLNRAVRRAGLVLQP